MPSAEIIAVGTEILLGDIADTNSQLLGQALAKFGISHHRRTTVGDNFERASAAMREALERTDIVITIGGLGPTMDDLTREAIAQAIGEELVVDDESLDNLRSLYATRGRTVSDVAARMAMRPVSAKHLANSVGTAPGILWESEGKTIIAMPGPRAEFAAMLDGPVSDFLASCSGGSIVSRTLRIVGIPESRVEEICHDVMLGENPTVSPYAKPMEVHLRITASAASQEAAQKLIPPVEDVVRGRLGDAVYGVDEEDLPSVVVQLLITAGATLATAESCTGGMLGERITSVPGSSKVFLGGFVTYSDDMKARSLGVARVDLDKFGAVSEPIARQMSEGVCRVTGATFGIGITGIAGPDGGSEEKPVGLVFISLTGPSGTEVRRAHLIGDRELIRFRATHIALDMLRLENLK